MLKTSKQKTTVGLDLEAGSAAATEVRANGAGAEVLGYGIAPLPAGVFREGEVVDAEALGDTLKALFSEHKLSRDVRIGIANQRVAVRTLHLPSLAKGDELETAIRFQAQEHIPMPLDQAVLDWKLTGRRSAEDGGGETVEVVAVAARRDMVGSVMDALKRAGLRPVGIDLSAFGMIRALASNGHAAVGAGEFVAAPIASYEERMEQQRGNESALAEPAVPARLYCNLGDVVNLAVAQGTACLFTRISPFGVEGAAQNLAERRELTLEHARQWLVHVGLEGPVEEVEGDPQIVAAAREVLVDRVAKLVDELRLSLKFYGTQAGALAVESVVACGPGTTIPGLVEHMQRELGYPFQVGRPDALAGLDAADAARLTLSYGLATES